MAVPEAIERRGFQVRSYQYHDLDGRPGFKLATQNVDGRRYLYMGHFWHRGWSILDVTDPDDPRLIRFIEGPADTWTLQVQVADGTMVTALEGLVEEQDDSYRILSALPVPAPSRGLAYRNYYDKGGRFGPHNQHHHQGHPAHMRLDTVVLLTYFNAGLRAYDLTDPRTPAEVGCFVAEDPRQRRGPKPEVLVTQAEDVLVDDRGLIFLTDKNHGLFVLEAEDPVQVR